MRMIVLGGGALIIKKIKLSKGMTPAEFESLNENGADIIARLKERSNRLNWTDGIGRIDWVNHRGELILWFLSDAPLPDVTV